MAKPPAATRDSISPNVQQVSIGWSVLAGCSYGNSLPRSQAPGTSGPSRWNGAKPVAFGTDNGFVEQDGQRQRVAVDHYELSEIAKLSGGKKYSADSASQLGEVYEAIRASVGTEKVPAEVTDRYAGLALIFAVLAALGVISLGARWP